MATYVMLDNIINRLNLDTTITAITWDRIFFGLPDKDQTWTYLCLLLPWWGSWNMISKATRVELRAIGWNKNTTFKTLSELIWLVKDNLLSSQDWGVSDSDWQYSYSIREVWSEVTFIDEKDRKTIVADIFINLIK